MRRLHIIGATSLAALWVYLCTALVPTAAGAPQQAGSGPYSLDFALEPHLQVITFHTQQGRVRVTLPQPLFAGQAYSGTVEAILEGASTATSVYTVEIAGKRAVVKDRAIRFTAPEAGRAPTILRDFRENEIARFDLTVSTAGPHAPASPGVWQGDRFRVPEMIEVNAPVPLLGPFDGNSATTGFKLRGVQCELLTEAPGIAMARCLSDRGGPLPAGRAHYEITKGGAKIEADTRAVSVELTGVPKDLANGKYVKIRLTVTGLAGLDRDAEIRLENLTPTLASIDRDPPISYFPHDLEYFFIQPKDVKAGGTYITERSLMGIQYGDPIRLTANLVIPTTPHEAAEQILRTPRKNLSKFPGVEHAEALAAFGDSEFPLLAEFLTDGELAWAAEDVLFQDRQKAAPLLLAAIPRMGGQPLETAIDLFRHWAEEDAEFPYRRELHDASRAVLQKGESVSATYALATTGSDADITLLRTVYERQQKAVGGANPVSPFIEATEAALARLGSPEQIANIKAGLRTEVKTTADSAVFTRAANQAAFAGREEFVPLLCGHLNDPHWSFGDYGIYPAASAANAINAIRHAKLSPPELAALCAHP